MALAAHDAIAATWIREHGGMFVRFLDGNIQHIGVDNLAFVPLELALADNNVHAWKVDWDRELAAAQVALVLDDTARPLILAAYKRMLEAAKAPRDDDWTPARDGVELVAVADPQHAFAFVYSITQRGALSATSILACNVPKHQASINRVAGLIRMLHHRASQGALVAAGQLIGEGADGRRFMLVAARAADVALLRKDVVAGTSPDFRAAEAAGAARLLVLVPLREGEGAAAHGKLVDIIGDFAGTHATASGLMGSNALGGTARRFE